METYFHTLESSSIPFSFWGLILVWMLVFGASHLLQFKAKGFSRAQNLMIAKASPELIREPSWWLVLGQFLFSAAVLTSAVFIGGPFYVFFGGGWVIMAITAFALSIRSVLLLRILSKSGAAEGSVTLSNYLTVKNQAYQLFGGAVLCVILGLFLAQLAFFGSAMFLSATAFGFYRKARGKAANKIPTSNN